MGSCGAARFELPGIRGRSFAAAGARSAHPGRSREIVPSNSWGPAAIRLSATASRTPIKSGRYCNRARILRRFVLMAGRCLTASAVKVAVRPSDTAAARECGWPTL
jgi:hypothetical protein